MRPWERQWAGWPRRASPRPVRFLVTLAQEERYFDLTQPMREAVQGHARTLVPLLEPETARELAAWYNKTYPRRRRLPVQNQLLKELERRANGK